MGNDLIFKIAVGVFLGIAAWANRANLGEIALYILGFFIIAFFVVACYQAVSNFIKQKLREQRINRLVDELLGFHLIDSHQQGALSIGLIRAFTEDDFNSLSWLIEEHRRDLRNGGCGEFSQERVSQLVIEIVDSFKQSSTHSAQFN